MSQNKNTTALLLFTKHTQLWQIWIPRMSFSFSLSWKVAKL